jgi:hypothetical protein
MVAAVELSRMTENESSTSVVLRCLFPATLPVQPILLSLHVGTQM